MKLGTHIDWIYLDNKTSLFHTKLTLRTQVFKRVMDYVINKDRMSTQRRLMIDMDSWLDNEFETTLKK